LPASIARAAAEHQARLREAEYILTLYGRWQQDREEHAARCAQIDGDGPQAAALEPVGSFRQYVDQRLPRRLLRVPRDTGALGLMTPDEYAELYA
jgi:hypothetical protein